MSKDELRQKLDDFFCVYFDDHVVREVRRRPDTMIHIIREAIQVNSMPPGRLAVYGQALRDSIDYHELLTQQAIKTSLGQRYAMS